MTYEIEKGVPMPGSRRKYPFAEMEVDDSFPVPKVEVGENAIACDVYVANQKLAPRHFFHDSDGDNWRVWRDK